jgi:hypothetical protein
MDEAVLQEKIAEMLSEAKVAAIQEGNGGPPPAERGPSARRQEMAALEEGLDHLRLAIKYLIFDLEATKRENRVLRDMLG